jgi:hypothetical protein
LGKIRIGELHHRYDPPIQGESEHCLGQALHISNDLLGRLAHPGQDMDLGYRPAFGDDPGSFDTWQSTDLLFKITKVHNSKRSCRGRWWYVT